MTDWLYLHRVGLSVGFALGWSAAFGLFLLIAAAARMNPEDEKEPDPHEVGGIG